MHTACGKIQELKAGTKEKECSVATRSFLKKPSKSSRRPREWPTGADKRNVRSIKRQERRFSVRRRTQRTEQSQRRLRNRSGRSHILGSTSYTLLAELRARKPVAEAGVHNTGWSGVSTQGAEGVVNTDTFVTFRAWRRSVVVTLSKATISRLSASSSSLHSSSFRILARTVRIIPSLHTTFMSLPV